MRKFLFLLFSSFLLLVACSNVDTKIDSLISGNNLTGKWQCDAHGSKRYIVFNDNSEFAYWNEGDSIIQKSGDVKGSDGTDRRMSLTYSIDGNSSPIKVALNISSVLRTVSRTSDAYGISVQDLADTYKNAPVVRPEIGGKQQPSVIDQDGYFAKANPQTVTKTERTFKDIASYIVQSGDTLSLIASRFHLKPETLIWENGLTLASTLKVGQSLNIPPVDGVSHRVASGQSIAKIATLYSIDAQRIIIMNDLQGKAIAQGQVIFVPSAKPLPQANSVSRSVVRSENEDATAVNIATTVVFVDKNTIEMSLKSEGSAQENQICVRQD